MIPDYSTLEALRRQHPAWRLLAAEHAPLVDTKFIESHRDVLIELFDLVLPPEAIDRSATGAFGFCQRYGFLDKPLRIRFRLLDAVCTDYGADISVIHHAEHRGSEIQTQRDLPRLTSVVAAMYNTLRDNRLRAGVRFEQERVEFGWVQQALADLQTSVHV